MLRVLFEWFDGHPASFWAIVALPTLGLIGWVAAGIRAPADAGSTRRTEWAFALLLLLFLFAWRWPYLLAAQEYNPDESQFIAGAMTLAHDPVFWRSVDGTTSGPLNFYALLPLTALGLPFDYFTARLTGLLLYWGALLACYRLFRLIAAPAAARLALLPAAIFFAASTEGDFVHYSSESVPVLLIALAAFSAVRRPLTGALIAGLLPWAKLQTLPMMGVFVCWLLWDAWTGSDQERNSRWRRSAAIVLAAMLPSLVALAAVAMTGQLEPFYRRYLLQNVVYVGAGFPLKTVVTELASRAQDTGHFTAWSAGMGLALVTGAVAYLRLRQRPGRLFGLSVALSIAALICVLAPGRTSLHYLRFLVFPLTLCVGLMVADLWGKSPRLPAAFRLVLFCTLLPLAWRLTLPPPEMFGQFAEHWRHPRTALGNILHAYKQPGERLAVWGWLNHAYVEAGMPQATRDTLTAWAILPSAQRDYYRQTYLADLQRNRPVLFADTVGRGSPYLDRRDTQGHETFPALAEHIRRNYRLLVELRFTRVYVRADLFAHHRLSARELQRLVATGRPEQETPTEPDSITPRHAPRADFQGRSVQLIEPPTTLTWQLHGTEREMRIEFGFLPKAYLEGRTNGAELIAELHMPGRPAVPIFARELDPVNQPADRSLLSARMALPPYPPGTTLTVRATNGKAGDGAWDWVFLAGLQFAYSPFYLPTQFPHFNRVPDAVAAPYPYLIGADHDLLMLPPPAALTFLLDGTERRLRFTFGIQEGAYSNGGQTDGATYRVELQRAAAPPQLLFERNLQPLGRPADRGRQQAVVNLPADIRPDDRLILHIDPAGSDSWDWTCVSNLELL